MAKSYFLDMDGVMVRGNEMIPGADAFIERLSQRQIKFLILTNNPRFTPADLTEDAVMVGDRMDTDIRIGTESGMETVLVLSGLTTREMVNRFPYRPTRVVDSVANLER